LRDGGCDFPINPALRADSAPVVWLVHLDPGAVLVAPAPEAFRNAARIGANRDLPAAVVIPLDADFGIRADAAWRLWRLVTGRERGRPPNRLTRQRRHRLGLALRALDARLAGASYRVIAAGLFSDARVPAGPGWKTHDLRDRTIRLVRAGMELMQGGYLGLLRE
jgi:hypothetical protein